MKTFITIIISFFIGIILFMPKENLFFTLQKELQKENIYINSEISSNFLYLNLTQNKIYINKINISKIENIKIIPILFFNKIELSNIKIDFNNLNIKNLNLTQTILNPFKIEIQGVSNFANIIGTIDLKKHYLKIYLINLTNNSIKSFLKKDQKGYFYDTKF